MRLKTQFWVQAYIRRCENAGLYGAVVHKGAPEAGAVYVMVNRLDGTALLFEPAPGPAYDDAGERRFYLASPEARPAAALSERTRRIIGDDPDIWLVEIEDRIGQALISEAKD